MNGLDRDQMFFFHFRLVELGETPNLKHVN